MDIFENLIEIEKIYEDLINNAKNLNLKDIEEFRENEQNKFEAYIGEKNELVNYALANLSKEVNIKVRNSEEKLDGAINKIELQFQKSIGNLQKLIIDKAGFDF